MLSNSVALFEVNFTCESSNQFDLPSSLSERQFSNAEEKSSAPAEFGWHRPASRASLSSLPFPESALPNPQ